MAIARLALPCALGERFANRVAGASASSRPSRSPAPPGCPRITPQIGPCIGFPIALQVIQLGPQAARLAPLPRPPPHSASCSSAAGAAADHAVQHSLVVPSLGDSITEGTIVEWKAQVGDFVAPDQVICVIETDKVIVDIHADVGGILRAVRAECDGVVFVGKELAVIEPVSHEQGAAALPASSGGGGGGGAPASGEAVGASVTSRVGRRIPLILFKHGLLKRTGASAAGVQAPRLGANRLPDAPAKVGDASEVKAAAGREIVVEKYADASELPAWLHPKLLSEQEVESVNLGAEGVCFSGSFGVWKTTNAFTTAKPQKTKGPKK